MEQNLPHLQNVLTTLAGPTRSKGLVLRKRTRTCSSGCFDCLSIFRDNLSHKTPQFTTVRPTFPSVLHTSPYYVSLSSFGQVHGSGPPCVLAPSSPVKPVDVEHSKLSSVVLLSAWPRLGCGRLIPRPGQVVRVCKTTLYNFFFFFLRTQSLGHSA